MTRKTLVEKGALAVPGTPARFGAFIAAERRRFGEIVAAAHVTVD